VRIGPRPLRLALGAGHHNARGGTPFEADLNGRVCRAIVDLARLSDGFEIQSYTPEDGLGIHPGVVDVGPREVAMTWDPDWPVDIFHEIHAQAFPSRPSERGVFLIHPDGVGLASDYPNPGEVDEDVVEHAATMARIISGTTGLPVGGPGETGVVSERQTLVGLEGRRLRIFAATATPGMVAHSCRFITEVGTHTNAVDRAIMSQPGFARMEAIGVIRAYASLAVTQLDWNYAYRIAVETEQCTSAIDR